MNLDADYFGINKNSELRDYLLNIIDSKTDSTTLKLNEFMTVYYDKVINYRGTEERRFWVEFNQDMCNEYVHLKERRVELDKQIRQLER